MALSEIGARKTSKIVCGRGKNAPRLPRCKLQVTYYYREDYAHYPGAATLSIRPVLRSPSRCSYAMSVSEACGVERTSAVPSPR